MLINLRNALMTGKRLPYDAEVEYLESTGTQWIDTGVVPTNTKTEITFSTPTPPSSGYMCGSFNANDNRYYPAAFSGSSTRYINLINAANTVISQHTNDGNVHTVVYNATGGACYFDGVAAGTLSTTTLTASNPIYLFGTSTATGVSGRVSGRVYSLKIYDENGTLVRDYIPVRKKTVGYLYDRVSGKLFGNAGTGDFVLGPDVVPVEYIESHGTEWIDTGIIVSGASNLTYDVMACAVDQAVNQRVFSTDGLTPNYTAYYTIGPDLLSTPSGARMNIANGINFRIRYDGSTMSIAAGETVVQKSYDFQSPTGSYGLKLFARANNTASSYVFKGRIIYADFAVSSVPYKLRPVRVGTEGAMMDVLTRRIYRNAGTGAFTYGNDLKYPIPAE